MCLAAPVFQFQCCRTWSDLNPIRQLRDELDHDTGLFSDSEHRLRSSNSAPDETRLNLNSTSGTKVESVLFLQDLLCLHRCSWYCDTLNPIRPCRIERETVKQTDKPSGTPTVHRRRDKDGERGEKASRLVSQDFISFNSSRSAPSWLTLAFWPLQRDKPAFPRSRSPSHRQSSEHLNNLQNYREIIHLLRKRDPVTWDQPSDGHCRSFVDFSETFWIFKKN